MPARWTTTCSSSTTATARCTGPSSAAVRPPRRRIVRVDGAAPGLHAALAGRTLESRWQPRGEHPRALAAPPPISLRDGLCE